MNTEEIGKRAIQESSLVLAETAKYVGYRAAMNDVLRWANDHKEDLRSAGLIESLISITTKE